MKGLISKGMAILCCAAASAGIGCLPDKCLDPCYPMRYNYMARQSVNAAMAPQVQNGHVLDQTDMELLFRAGHGQADERRSGAVGLSGAAPAVSRYRAVFADGPGCRL